MGGHRAAAQGGPESCGRTSELSISSREYITVKFNGRRMIEPRLQAALYGFEVAATFGLVLISEVTPHGRFIRRRSSLQVGELCDRRNRLVHSEKCRRGTEQRWTDDPWLETREEDWGVGCCGARQLPPRS